jgi:hypothetical protein
MCDIGLQAPIFKQAQTYQNQTATYARYRNGGGHHVPPLPFDKASATLNQ